MRDVQWDKTGDGLTTAVLVGGDGGGSPIPPARLYAERVGRPVWPHGGEDVEGMDLARTRGHAPDEGRFARFWPLLWLVWLPALIQAIAEFFHARPTPPRLIAVLAGLALFIAIYLWAAWHSDVTRGASLAPLPPASWRWRWAPIAMLTALSVILILGDGPRWLGLLIYTCACATGRLPLGQATRAVVLLMLFTVVLGLLQHDAWPDLVLEPFWVGITGTSVILLSYLRRTNHALRAAREEVARLAVEAERLRFARDLHDLLGHDLARIALQSELAEALVPAAPDQAVAAMREVGDAARTALREVRAAVAGYRRPTLASELRGAGEILAAAGIAYRREGEADALPPAVEAVLAWAVREGVTNAVKHSRARHCIVRVTREGGYAGVEVCDDGAGASGSAGAGGNANSSPVALTSGYGGSGLTGLAERAVAEGGRCEAGPRPGGGFCLSVVLPVATDTAVETTGSDRPAAPVETGGRP